MFVIPYSCKTFRVGNTIIPGNETSDTPVEFDLQPAEGEDRLHTRAILNSLMVAEAQRGTALLAAESYDNLARALDRAPRMFSRCVTKIRGLSVPGDLAKRKGLIADNVPVPEAFPIVNGEQFALVSGFMPLVAFSVALEIGQLGHDLKTDARFIKLPGGSGGPATPGQRRTTAGRARKKNGTSGTAD